VAPSYGADDWLFDTLVGLRFGQVVSRHWGHRLEADVSTSGTDYTWSVAPALRYVWGQADRCEVGVGYRHMVIDLANAGDLEPKMSLSGLVVSFRFSF